MVEHTLLHHRILRQQFEEKMHRVEFCFSHGSRLIQEIDTYTADLEIDDEIELDDKISEAKAFIFTGHDDIEELRDIYLELKDKKYQPQNATLWPPADDAFSTSSSLADLTNPVQEIDEKIRHVQVCLFHGRERVKQLDELIHDVQEETDHTLAEKMIEIKSFMCAGYEEIDQLGDLYGILKGEKKPFYDPLPPSPADASLLDPLKDLKEMIHA